ncbi:cobalamin biosynthesis protein CobQ [Terasakiispira papahanaumokuakeensis]|uniref:Cobalamin biosynthesis protein CobQ n=1 Tax=Terasakiispira papahanaumokuakeensis TaxID=197479 RepID=A0A1E2VAU4_9GAMM|nr:ParA family protein [Terasakiispira papahanaumokuakeensis]ODC04138.1 cobalamin biosynthesis protein CobQ [Terasakiispira papahanaumokuakeensis]
MHVWAVANQKGGVGKTTSVVTLGGLLADRGHQVLLLDLDPHGSLTSYFKYDPDNVEKSAYELFQHRQMPEDLPASLLLDTGHDRLKIMAASTALATLERQASGKGGQGLVVSKALAMLWNRFDYVLIDSPPVLGLLMINALAACQQLIVPVQTEFLAIKGLERMMRTLRMVNKARKHDLPYAVVPTLYDRRAQASVQSLRLLRNTYGDSIWHGMVPVDTKFREASVAGMPASMLDPNSRGVHAYSVLLKFLLDRQNERHRLDAEGAVL